MRRISLLILILLFIPLVYANGLSIEETSSFVVNKTVGHDESIILKIKNTDSFDFYNITLEENDYIEIETISTLSSGQIATVTATVKADVSIDQDIKVQGFYISDLGQGYENYSINVDYNDGISDCDLVIIKGDRVTWNNFVNDEVKMINIDTGAEVTTIDNNSSYSSVFDFPEELNYYFNRRGFKFTDNCKVTALDTSGPIHNPNYDASFRLKVNTNYDPTTLSKSFVETSYNLSYNEETEGIFTIKNTGNNIAKNIHISGEWITFNENDFDLSPGATKGVIYSVRPLVTKTNDTGKTYEKEIVIEGNFETLTQNISISVPYSEISEDYSSGNTLIDVLIAYCEDNPSESFCNPEEIVVYGNGTSNEEFNVTFSEGQVREIFEYMFEQGDSQDVFMNIMKEGMDSINTKINSTDLSQQDIALRLKQLEEGEDNKSSMFIFAILSIFFILIVVLLSSLIYYYRKKKKTNAIKLGTVIDNGRK